MNSTVAAQPGERGWGPGQHLCPHLVATDTNYLPGLAPGGPMILPKLNLLTPSCQY